MKVLLSDKEQLPPQNYSILKEDGFKFYWRGGDVILPFFGNWFIEPYFKWVIHFFCPIRILPFISWRKGRYGFYFGFKAFGVDAPEYVNWLPKEDVYDGSIALHFSSRIMSHIDTKE